MKKQALEDLFMAVRHNLMGKDVQTYVALSDDIEFALEELLNDYE